MKLLALTSCYFEVTNSVSDFGGLELPTIPLVFNSKFIRNSRLELLVPPNHFRFTVTADIIPVAIFLPFNFSRTSLNIYFLGA